MREPINPLTILTAYTPDNEGSWTQLAWWCLSKLNPYAVKHGYGLDVLRGGHGDTSRAYPWQKTEWVRDWLLDHPECSAVWVLDIDVLITNPEITIESFMDDDHDLFIGEDVNGLNTGSYIVRNMRRSTQWLTAALALHGVATSENHAFQIMHRERGTAVKIVEGLNSIPYERYPTLGRQEHSSQWAPGHLLLHLPGMTPEARVAIFKEFP